MPEVSVILPTRNRAHSVAASIYSVLSQSVGDIELIVVDDGSTDGTLDLLAGIHDSRLRVVRSSSSVGAAGARNYGAQFACGNILAFQDSDDLWLVDKLKHQLPVMNDPAVVMVCGAYLMRGRTGQMGYEPAEAWMRDGIWTPARLYNFTFITPTWLVRRDLFNELGGFDESMPNLEDWEFALRAFAKGKIKVVETPVVVKYGGSDSLNWNPEFRTRSLNRVIDKHKDILAAFPEVLARLYAEVGTLHFHNKDSEKAKEFLRAALSYNSKDAKTWGKYLAVLAGPKASERVRQYAKGRRVRGTAE